MACFLPIEGANAEAGIVHGPQPARHRLQALNFRGNPAVILTGCFEELTPAQLRQRMAAPQKVAR